MKVAGEAFRNFRKSAEEARYQMYPNFQAKGLLPDRTLESFIQKSTDGAILNFLGTPIQNLLKELFPNFIGRIFQVKGKSNRVK